MKKILPHPILLTIAASILLAASCKPSPFKELDELLDRKDEIDAAVRRTTDSLRMNYVLADSDSLRWACAEDLYEAWRHLNLDSCSHYTQCMLHYAGGDRSRVLRSKAALVRTLVRAERVQEADSIFKSLSLPPDASRADCEAYFYCADRLTNQMTPRNGEALVPLVQALASDFMSRDSSSVKARLLHVKALRYAGHQDQAIAYALSMSPDKMEDIYDVSSYYIALSSLYSEMHDSAKSASYATMSACVDIGCGMKDYFSLYMLAQLLFRNGDRQRAGRYMNRAVQDALEYNYPVGVRRSARASSMMSEAIRQMNLSRRRILAGTVVMVSVLLAVAILMLFYSLRMLRRVRLVNHKYKNSQSALRNVSLIKDKMLGEYMELSSEYIYKVDENRSRYRKILKENGPEALMAVFREPSYADSESPHYWSNFDKIFLSIFPDFVAKVNNLMPEESHFIPDGPGSLTTELRILALIRLGITESKRISVILHISKGTVYTYRSVMRQASLNPDAFEENIREIDEL